MVAELISDGPDHASPRIITVTVDDGVGGVAMKTLELAVNNAAPAISLAGADKANGGAAYAL